MARPFPLWLGYNVLLESFMDRNDLHGRHPHISLSWDDMVEIRFFNHGFISIAHGLNFFAHQNLELLSGFL